MVRRSVRRKTQFLARDLIVVVENRYMLASEIAVRAERVFRRIEAVEIGAPPRQTLGHRDQCRSHLTDVERGIEVAVENVEITVRGEIAAGDLADQEEIVLADIGGELFDRAAEVAGLLLGYVLQRVDAETVAICQGDPVFVAGGQCAENIT